MKQSRGKRGRMDCWCLHCMLSPTPCNSHLLSYTRVENACPQTLAGHSALLLHFECQVCATDRDLRSSTCQKLPGDLLHFTLKWLEKPG